MLKLMILGRRAPGRSRHQAHRHLKDMHGPMVLQPPPDAGVMPKNYVQNHIIDGTYPGTGAYEIERDLFTQIWFDDFTDLQASTGTEYYLSNLKPDEPRFVDESSVVRLMVRPDVLLGGPEGPYKAFFVLGLTDAGRVGIAALRERATSHFAQVPGIGAVVCNHVMTPPPGDAAPFADLVFEAWFEDCAEARAAFERLDALLASLPEASYDHVRCLALLAEAFTSERLLLHYEGSSGFG